MMEMFLTLRKFWKVLTFINGSQLIKVKNVWLFKFLRIRTGIYANIINYREFRLWMQMVYKTIQYRPKFPANEN